MVDNKSFSMTGKLMLTSGGRVTLDNHGCEVYCEPYDKILMSVEELERGISLLTFMKRIEAHKIGNNRG